jgi:hypothetical protein
LVAGQFLIEYIGEVLEEEEYIRRKQYYIQTGQRHYYFMNIGNGEVIDACRKVGSGSSSSCRVGICCAAGRQQARLDTAVAACCLLVYSRLPAQHALTSNGAVGCAAVTCGAFHCTTLPCGTRYAASG